MYARLFLILLALFSTDAKAQTIQESVAFAIIGEPKYAAGFSHFDYVNPVAPKGGTLTPAAIGTFDNFNRYALRGDPAVRTEALYDTLFTTSDDEPGSYYPLIAERARYAEDYSGWRSRSTRAPASMTVRRSPPAMWRLPSTSL